MKQWLTIGVVLVVVAAGGYSVYLTMQDREAPADDLAPGGGDGSGGSAEEAQAIEAMLKSTEWLVVSDYAPDALLERLSQSEVTLSPQEREAVVPLLANHMRTLRENLEAARDAARGDTTPQQRMRHVAAAAQAHGAFQRAVRDVVSPETARALFKALPDMVPPRPAAEQEAP